MKKINYGLLIIAMLVIASFSQLNAQVYRVFVEDFEINVWVPCANDGIGENVVGEVRVMLQVTPSNSFVGHPLGGYAVGDVTGIKYQVVGATHDRINDDENGAQTYRWVDRYHLVGKGTHYYIKDTYHMVMTPGGEWVVTVDNSELICK